MNVEDAVRSLLEDGGIADVFVDPPSVLECAEPVVVGHAKYERDATFTDGERGTYSLSVFVCREIDRVAQDAAAACERVLADAEWERYGDGLIVSMDVSAPRFSKRDSSGRYVYEVAVSILVDKDAR